MTPDAEIERLRRRNRAFILAWAGIFGLAIGFAVVDLLGQPIWVGLFAAVTTARLALKLDDESPR